MAYHGEHSGKSKGKQLASEDETKEPLTQTKVKRSFLPDGRWRDKISAAEPDDKFRGRAALNKDFNSYAHKKNAAKGLLDLALLMANASQLKYILMTEGNHRFYGAMLAFVIISIFLQLFVGIALLFLGPRQPQLPSFVVDIAIAGPSVPAVQPVSIWINSSVDEKDLADVDDSVSSVPHQSPHIHSIFHVLPLYTLFAVPASHTARMEPRSNLPPPDAQPRDPVSTQPDPVIEQH